MVATFCFKLAVSRQAEIGFQRASEHRNFALVSRYVASWANYEILSRTYLLAGLDVHRAIPQEAIRVE